MAQVDALKQRLLLLLAQQCLVTRSTGRGTVSAVSSMRIGSTVNGVRDLVGQGLAGVGGMRLFGVHDREDGTLPVVALANGLVNGGSSLGV